MELVKDIYFNTDKLVENTKVKVSYTGKFYQGNNEKVFLHYGYGKNWNNVNEVEMTKTDLGYQAELDLKCDDTVNFCFKNQNNEWDNNFGNNYIFNIEKQANPIIGSINGHNINSSNINGGNINVGNVNGYNTNGGNINGSNINAGNITDGTVNTGLGNTFKKITESDSIFNNSIENDCFKVITPSFEKPVENSVKPVDNIFQTVEIPVIANPANIGKIDNTVNINATQPFNKQPGNAIALAPTGFIYWTKKIKETVCKFFTYVPKLISGNYKRTLSKHDKKA